MRVVQGMIVEAAILGASAIVVSATWAGVWLTNRMHAREEKSIRAEEEASRPMPPVNSLAEERRLLERQREQWMNTIRDPEMARTYREEASRRVIALDERLIELARRTDAPASTPPPAEPPSATPSKP